MLTSQSMRQTIRKLERLTGTLYSRIFIPVGQAEMTGCFQTKEPLHQIPQAEAFSAVPGRWGSEGVYAWFSMNYTVPEDLDGKALFFYPHTGFYEATLWVNGRIHSNFATKEIEGSHGNHWCNRFTDAAKAGESFDFALECYAWHDVPGTQPLHIERITDYTYAVGKTDICVRDEQVLDFLFDLKALLSLRESLDEDSFRRAEVENALYNAHLKLYYDPALCSEEAFRNGLKEASVYLKAELNKKACGAGAYVGLIGHSHMDTAWLWPLTETEKKCARTYANTLNLMDEYPEYRFVQSSAYHAEMLRKDYPELFARIQKAVAEGRYEPNGGVWVECDCNLTGGEYMIRQFLWGQRFTRKYFNYTSDAFWLPDTFGYSFAIPQIMQGCGVRYFLTTKIEWNDTNHFPMTTFYWQGLDGTKVLTHFNRTHVGPDPCFYSRELCGRYGMPEKRVTNMRLFSFGKGDGGGGPEFEMLESARRIMDLEGTAHGSYTTVSEFMNRLEQTAVDPGTYADELYLELHRGTLTNQHTIKHNNRFCEIALHNLELALVSKAVRENLPADESPAAPMMNTLLVHQFHDILPGTCIHTVHQETYQAVGQAIADAEALTQKTLASNGTDAVVMNPLGFDRTQTFRIEGSFPAIEGANTQTFTDIDGRAMTSVSGLTLPALGSRRIVPGGKTESLSPFRMDGDHLTTPFAEITFDENGAIRSFVDRRNGRELVQGLPFNTFLMAEDMPASWDNWDIDADEEPKFAPAGKLISREIVSDGAVELRIRSTWQLTEKSSIIQDMVFDTASPLVSFDTCIEWHEGHRFLKTAFDTSLRCDGVRSEIQFGCIRRSNHRSTPVEKARFEVCNHKYSDLSETNYGFAILNDSKYGLSVNEGSMRLSLHKGGMLPDEAGDMGRHYCRYAILPHTEGFGAETVVRPAYAFNYLPVVVSGGAEQSALFTCDDSNVMIETVKPCEDTQNAYIVRLYETVGGYSRARLTFSHPVKAIFDCNMLEEELEALDPAEAIEFTPFKIRTIKVCY